MKYDVVIIGGGLAGMTAGVQLQKAGKRTLAVAFGLSMHQTPRAEYVALGGTVLAGDLVKDGIFENGILKGIHTAKLGKTAIYADNFILSTGKFFSKGLISTMSRVYEPVFGCDVEYVSDRSKWVSQDFFADQPFMAFGVKTDEKGCVSIDGKTVSNLYAAGEILCGENVDIVESALKICRNLI